MSNTKFIKVDVTERLPQSSGNYWILDVVGEMKSSYFNATLKSFPAYDFVQFWMNAIPDRESELIEMLESIIQDFEGDYVLDGEIVDKPYNWLIERYKEAKELIQSVKSERL